MKTSFGPTGLSAGRTSVGAAKTAAAIIEITAPQGRTFVLFTS
jgi:hypothetical protein